MYFTNTIVFRNVVQDVVQSDKNLTNAIILPKANVPYLQIVAVVLNKHVIHHVRSHHSHLAKKAPSQSPPSKFNLHYFSGHTFLTGQYPYHHSKGS